MQLGSSGIIALQPSSTCSTADLVEHTLDELSISSNSNSSSSNNSTHTATAAAQQQHHQARYIQYLYFAYLEFQITRVYAHFVAIVERLHIAFANVKWCCSKAVRRGIACICTVYIRSKLTSSATTATAAAVPADSTKQSHAAVVTFAEHATVIQCNSNGNSTAAATTTTTTTAPTHADSFDRTGTSGKSSSTSNGNRSSNSASCSAEQHCKQQIVSYTGVITDIDLFGINGLYRLDHTYKVP
jgi:hypothetical protein